MSLPFFNDTVNIAHLVILYEVRAIIDRGYAYAGYSIDGVIQRIVFFSRTAPMEYHEYTVNDNKLFYGVKDGENIDIWNAVMGSDSDTGVARKGWAFKIHIEGETFFSISSSGESATNVAGQPKGIFLLRRIDFEINSDLGIRDKVLLLDYAGGSYTILQEEKIATAGTPITTTTIAKPDAISDAMWLEMVNFINTTIDPEDTALMTPNSTDDFNGDFLLF